MRREMETPAETETREETVAQEKFETPEEAEKQGELGTSEETGISEIQEKSEAGQMEAGIEERTVWSRTVPFRGSRACIWESLEYIQ